MVTGQDINTIFFLGLLDETIMKKFGFCALCCYRISNRDIYLDFGFYKLCNF